MSSNPAVHVVEALSATIASLLALALLRPAPLAVFAALFAIGLAFRTRTLRSIWLITKWVLPFLIPLLLVHGVLNASFPIDEWFLNFIPVRKTGLRYGIAVGLNILVLAEVAALWLQARRDDVVEALIRLRLPLWAVLFASQSVAVAKLVELRIAKTYQAQRARGIRVGPGIFARISALPSVLIPATITTLLEAERRIPALVSRGFGACHIAPLPAEAVPMVIRAWAATPVVLLLFSLIVQRYA